MIEMGYIQQLFADRIGGSQFGLKDEIYKFEKIKRAKREALKRNPEKTLIDLGVGEPDTMADERIVRKLAEEAKRTENRFYADNGILEFQQAAVSYMKDVFGVEGLDPENGDQSCNWFEISIGHDSNCLYQSRRYYNHAVTKLSSLRYTYEIFRRRSCTITPFGGKFLSSKTRFIVL